MKPVVNTRWLLETRWTAIGMLVTSLLAAQSRDSRQPAASRSAVAAHYGIAIDAANVVFPIATSHGVINGRNASPSFVDDYLVLFCREFRLYPRDLIFRTKLVRVVLCEQLSFAGQLRNAVPDLEHDTLYLDVRRGGEHRSYLRAVIHHEFFHMIDYRDDGILYRDPQWTAVNPPGFQYGTGGTNAQHMPTTSVLTDQYPGFLNHYSTTGVEEDKAELFANLLVVPREVVRRAEGDIVLRRKVELMKIQLGRFCPDVDASFWQQAAHTR